MKNSTANPILQSKSIIGEGALWCEEEQVLYWVDIMKQLVHVHDPKRNDNKSYEVGSDVGTVVKRKSGGLMLAIQNGFASFDLGTEKVELIREVEAELPNNRFNDGKCDPAGRFWAGTMCYDYRNKGQGALYVLDAQQQVEKKLSDVTCSNGIVWTKDLKSMYYIDSLEQAVHHFDYDNATGEITNRRVAISVPEEMGIPDGMAIDSEGNLWVALYGGGCVACWNPESGELLQQIEVPDAKYITSCAFGGEDLKDLYITSATAEFTDQDWKTYPNGGALFKVRVDAVGTTTFSYSG